MSLMCLCTESVVFTMGPHCNNFAAITFNKNLMKKLKIPLYPPSNYLIRRGSCQLWVGQLFRDPIMAARHPVCRAQRKIHARRVWSWALVAQQNLRRTLFCSGILDISISKCDFNQCHNIQLYKKGLSLFYLKFIEIQQIAVHVRVFPQWLN